MSSNNGDKLQEAITNVLNTQAIMQTSMSKLAERQVESDKQWFELKNEMSELRCNTDKVIEVLNKHTITLENLPNAIREKIGFKL